MWHLIRLCFSPRVSLITKNKPFSGMRQRTQRFKGRVCGVLSRSAAQCFRQRLHEFTDGRDLAVLRNELEVRGADRERPGIP